MQLNSRSSLDIVLLIVASHILLKIMNEDDAVYPWCAGIHNDLFFVHRKYEEISAPRVEDFCFITDNTYTKAEVPRISSHWIQ